MSLKANVIANFAGQGWRAAMALAFVPLYIRILGVEAYGLIGLFAALQLWLSLLDLGVRPVLSREAARYTGGAHDVQGFWTILRSAECIALVMALVAAGAVALLSPWLATHWVNPQRLSGGEVAQAFVLMGVVAALQMLESLYASALAGLQRQVVQNAIQTAIATLRALGAVAVLSFVSPTVSGYFVWQAIVSAISMAALAFVLYRALPSPPIRARFSIAALHPLAGYAGGMIAIAILSIAVTQIDKLILAGRLPLAAFGHYVLAASVAGVIGMVTAPIGAAYFPRFAELFARADDAALGAAFRSGTQLAVLLAATAAAMLVFFGDRLVFVWTGDRALAGATGPLLFPLAVGACFHAIVSMAYFLQLASGWTRLSIMLNLVIVVVLVPALFWVLPRFGALGAAWLWAMVAAANFVASPSIMFSRLLPSLRKAWYVTDVAIPLAAAALAGFLTYSIVPVAGRWFDLLLLFINGAVILGAILLAAPLLRVRLSHIALRLYRMPAGGNAS